jgi:hypothetical protein
MAKPVTFCQPPENLRPVFDALVANVDWRPLDHSGKPPAPSGMVRPTLAGARQLTGKALRCYKLEDGSVVFNGDDMAALLGVSVEALSDERRFNRERASHG